MVKILRTPKQERAAFAASAEREALREVIDDARQRGKISADVAAKLDRAKGSE